MTEWHTIPAKFSSDEKKLLDILHDVYGMNYNQSLKAGVEILARLLAMGEFHFMADSKIMKKINRIGKKYMRLYQAEIKKTLEKIPLKQQEAEYEKVSTDKTKILSQFDKVFVKNRKRGRKKLPRKKGRPSSR